jgi:hypothetical protein
MKPVLGLGRQVDLVNRERETEQLYNDNSGPVRRLYTQECPRPILDSDASLSLIKGYLSQELKDTSEDESQTKEEINADRTSSHRKQKKVGFKSFITRFFDPNK